MPKVGDLVLIKKSVHKYKIGKIGQIKAIRHMWDNPYEIHVDGCGSVFQYADFEVVTLRDALDRANRDRVYMVDHNPNWGMRFQHIDRQTFGPYGERNSAESKRLEILRQMGVEYVRLPEEDTPWVEIIEKRII